MIEIQSLREQVYGFLREEMYYGRIKPGSFINLSQLSKLLGVSKTPLRDALIQLECEGFVEIQPRKGFLVKKLGIEDVKNILEVIGALESSVILSVFNLLDKQHIDTLEKLNNEMTTAVEREDFETYYRLNIDFHDVFLNLNQNTEIHRIVTPLKQRLYDFPRRPYIKEWELMNCREHRLLISHIVNKKPTEAVDLWYNSHWSFKAYEKFIREFYADSDKKIAIHLNWK